MSTKSNKNSINKLFKLAGVVSASVFLCLPAFAITNSQVSDSEQFSKERTLSSKELLAQTSPGGSDDTTSPSSPGGSDMNSPSSPGGSDMNSPSSPGGSDMNSPSSPGGSDMNSPSSPEGGSDATTSPSSPRPSENTAPPPASGSSSDEQAASSSQRKLERGSWFCMNNPNPQCR